MERNTRWWEVYAVRYFVGTAFGVAVLMVLKISATNDAVGQLLSEYSNDFWKDAVVLGSAGLAFCYIASAPILLFHAVRGDWNLGVGAMNIWRRIVIGATGIVIVAFIAAAFLGDSGRGDKRGFVIGSILLITIVSGQMILLCRALLNRLVRVVDYYENLATNRYVAKGRRGDEYVESYRHLREHGNAKSIVLCEMALGFILNVAQTNTQFVIAVALWLLPSAFCWFIGTVLEHRFAFPFGR